MIARSEMMPALLEACPSFGPAYDEFCAEWKEDAAELNYLALAELARHIAEMLDRNETQTFPTFFALVERLILEGDSYARNAIIVGLLEDLQNPSMHPRDGTKKPDDLIPYFGPEAKYWWQKLYGLWNEGLLLVDDRKPQTELKTKKKSHSGRKLKR